MEYEKQFVRKHLNNFKPRCESSLEYTSVAEAGWETVEPVFESLIKNSLSRDDHSISDVSAEVRTLIELAGDSYEPANWFLAKLDDAIVGLVFPQRYPHDHTKGTIFYIGILPAFRGRGFGRVLHEKGLETLAAQGTEIYIGSADVLNQPMLDIFNANECIFESIRTVSV